MRALFRSSFATEVVPPALVGGFAAATAVWTAWYFTHLPWLDLSEQVSKPTLILVWLASLTVVGASVHRHLGRQVGAAAGLISAALGLLLLVSIVPQESVGAQGQPGWVLVTAGFLALGLVLGAIGGVIGRSIAWPKLPGFNPDWQKRFALVTLLAAAPLVFAGGLVTSTGSGMAVPDWPTTFGANMFLYPLGPRVDPGVFIEHSHRLFGTLVGLASFVVMMWGILDARGPWPRALSVAVFAVVLIQGLIGAARVLWGSADPATDSRGVALFHGVSAQLIVALLATLVCLLSRTWREIEPFHNSRSLRRLATAAFHLGLLQMVFGAMYRHMRSDHALWTHAAFAILVMLAALAAGFRAWGTPHQAGPPGRTLRGLGLALLVTIGLQFAAGWLTFALGGNERHAQTVGQALLRTTHQANGALVIALSASLAVLARRAAPRSAAPAPA